MNALRSTYFLGALVALAGGGVASAAEVDTSQWKCELCPFEKGVSGSVDVGAGVVSDDAPRFGDYTGLDQKGAYAVVGGGLRLRGDGGLYASAQASGLALDSRALDLGIGTESLGELRLGYAEIPRWLSSTALTPFLGNGGGTLTLPAGYPATSTAAMPLATTLQPVQAGYKRSIRSVGLSWHGGESWTVTANARQDVRDGTRPIFSSFFSSATQMLAPVDEVTDQFDVTASYRAGRVQASLAYHASAYRNKQQSVTWANPYSAVVPGADRGQLALAPDNDFQQLTASAAYQYSPAIRASGEVAFGRMTQDSTYFDTTLNSGLATTLAPLPAPSLRGKVDTFNAAARISAVLNDAWRVYASYARNVHDNRTPVESYAAVATDMFASATPRTNQPFSFWHDRARVQADYRGSETIKASIGGEFDRRERSYQEVVTTDESTLWGRVALQPLPELSTSLKLAWSQRTPSTYGVATWVDPAENPLLRKFNLADRRRGKASLRADYQASAGISVGAQIELSDDDYRHSTIGLTEGRALQAGLDGSAALGEDTTASLFLQREQIRSRQAGSQAFAQADWWATTKDVFDVVGLGVRHLALSGKLELRADVSVARSRGDLAVDAGAAEPALPRATTSRDTVKLQAVYQIQKSLSLVGSVWHEAYTARDWHVDGLGAAAAGNLLTLGDQATRYRVNVLQVAIRQRF